MIPKIIHQLWIGPRIPPTKLMNTWKEKHPDYVYILWNETEFETRQMTFRCMKQIETINEINGKADIMRWEILYKYGGIFIDADTICIEPLDDTFIKKEAFALFENENVRNNLIATTYMGFQPNHPLCRDIIEWIATSQELNDTINIIRAWGTVGPGLLTRFLETGKYPTFSVFPSHCLLPTHFTGLTYRGHKKVFGYHEWGTAKETNDSMHELILPPEFQEPTEWVSVLISSYNTHQAHIHDCLRSIKNQQGYFGMEIVWMNDGSNDTYTKIVEYELELFAKTTRFCKIVYKTMDKNYGTNYTLHHGVLTCSHPLIFKMDADDIMFPERIETQIQFMKDHPHCVVCGTNVYGFETGNYKKIIHASNHPFHLTWETFLQDTPDWFINHQTLCFRKEAVLAVGNYNKRRIGQSLMEDYELILRLLKRYNEIYTLPQKLVYYRIHPGQLTFGMHRYHPEIVKLRNEILNTVIIES